MEVDVSEQYAARPWRGQRQDNPFFSLHGRSITSREMVQWDVQHQDMGASK